MNDFSTKPLFLSFIVGVLIGFLLAIFNNKSETKTVSLEKKQTSSVSSQVAVMTKKEFSNTGRIKTIETIKYVESNAHVDRESEIKIVEPTKTQKKFSVGVLARPGEFDIRNFSVVASYKLFDSVTLISVANPAQKSLSVGFSVSIF